MVGRPTHLARRAALERGDTFDGRFTIEAPLGQGGFARVYLARANADPVVLKVLLPDDGVSYRPSTRARYEREAKILSQLKSPFTVRLLEHGEADGRLFLTFEYLRGRDLRAVLNDVGRLAPADVAHVLRQVLRALDEAHRLGLVHRDIKPENIFVTEEAGDTLRVRLLDFGIARPQADGHPNVTRTGELIGTPRYMSPEQLSSRPLGPQSDLYSLGVVGIELLAGSEQMHGNSLPAQIERMRSGHLFSVPALEGADRLIAVIERMTARDPAARFASAEAALHALQGDERQPRANESAPVRDGGPRWRGIAVAAASLALLAGVGFWLSGAEEPPPPSAVHRQVRANPLAPGGAVEEPTPGGEPDAELVAVDASVADAGRTVWAGPSPGCGRPGTLGKGKVEGVDFSAPRKYEPGRAYPLIIALHGEVQRPTTVGRESGLSSKAYHDGLFIVGLPAGTPRTAEMIAWDDVDAGVASVRRVVDLAAERFCIDMSRIYVFGHGDGGRVALALRCEPWVTKVAVHAHAVTDREALVCEPAKPLLWLHPARSIRVPTKHARSCRGFDAVPWPEVRESLQRAQECTAERPKREVGDAVCRRWDCAVDLQVCELRGGAAFPGTPDPPLATAMLRDCPAETSAEFPLLEKLLEFFEIRSG